MDTLITNVSYAIFKQLGYGPDIDLNPQKFEEIKEVVKNQIECCPLFRFQFEYKNCLEVSLEFDGFLNECLNDAFIRE